MAEIFARQRSYILFHSSPKLKKGPAIPRKTIEILLVEDSPTDRLIITEAFTKSRLKTEIHSVGDGVEALKYVRREHPYSRMARPDLILLDLNLPRMSGHEVLSTLKESAEYRTIPIAVLSSSADSEDIRKAYSHYANCYISKPVEFKGFIRAVRSIEQFWFKIGAIPST